MAKSADGFGLVKWLIIIAIVGGVTAAGYWYWQHPHDTAPDYKTAEVTKGDLMQLVTATGQLNPQTNVDVGSQVSGIISRLMVDYNSPVTNGQVIAQLDPATYKAIVAGAQADLANSKAGLELAKAEEEREDALYQSKIVAQSDYDTAVATYHQAQAQVMMKEAALEQAQVNLAYTTIYAPVDGVVISRNVDVGQTVAASLSAPTLFMIANDLTKMQIDADVSEADIGGVETNQPVSFTVDAFPTRIFQGVVQQIRNAPETNQNVVTYDTVISVDNSELKLRPGMTANVNILTAQRTNVLKIPNSALRFHPPEADDAKKENGQTANAGQFTAQTPAPGQGKPVGGKPISAKQRAERVTRTVYVLDQGAEGNHPTARAVQVRVGINDGINTQLLDGLKEGDEVIVGVALPTVQTGGGNPFGGRRF